ncbi:MAG: hypothetical protein JXA87_09035 [Thermoleophilia bacterium]|nr:hypothetical protein [Thermoleophilia bacterium]
MKDLSILPEHLRETVMVAGGDLGWPLEMAAEVIRTLADAGAVVTGVEAWSVDAEGVPASVGWSSYDLDDYVSDWEASVITARAEAEAVLAGVLETAAEDEVNYVGIDWDYPQPVELSEES